MNTFANAFMQYLVGYNIVLGRLELVDFTALVTTSYGGVKFFYAVFSSYIVRVFLL